MAAQEPAPLAADDVLAALASVVDPDLGDDIVSLGMVEDVEVGGGAVRFALRLTTPACPHRDALRDAATQAVLALPGVTDVAVRLTARTLGQAAAGALGGVRNVVLVGAGKGGVGKTTATVQLALGLAAQGARVAVLDADLYGPSLVHVTGVGPPEPAPTGRLIPPEHQGVAVGSVAQFLPAGRATMLRGPRISAMLQQLVSAFDWGERDYLRLVDLPPGTGDVPLALAQLVPLAGAVLVTTPQDVAVLDTRRAAHLFKTLGVPVLGVVETMAPWSCPCCGERLAVFGADGGRRLAADLDVPLLASLPLDPSVGRAGEDAAPERVQDGPQGPLWRAAASTLAQALAVRWSRAGARVDALACGWHDVAPWAGGDAPGRDGAVGVRQVDARTLEVRFPDGEGRVIDVEALRAACPCALCEGSPPDATGVRPAALRSVGRHALGVAFSDGHDAGMYPWALLRRLGAPRG